jgi:MFS family permease
MTQVHPDGQADATAHPRLGIIFGVVLLDIISFSLLLPVLPYYATTLGATPTEVGLLTGLYALCQFFGAPLIGRLSDTVGRKPMFLVDIGGNFIGFLVLASASSLWMLLLAA